ncbi:hypothetical protein [Actinokineospora globicatena]|uniref:hypothetical protein n=1 Tax=Actinokineospora globicatena TaxID=103729 RepID=UPI0020A25782|nr:hypothetical protein [Actinokineospora globicatena]MCP2306106.1 hypothetical protein [Actinokineospora globicatena]GLW80020.1 hypothetical protein Aglo01_45010 [Actinokineospora globicatena]GLW86849.1 hypothetical protein Aglo02_44880 [Actinokineospora globicatena]
MRDMVHVNVTDDLPIRAKALPFADRVEIRFGKAFPVVLIVDRAALDMLAEAIATGRAELEAASPRETP